MTQSHPSSDVRYRWKVLRAGPFWLDGGSMFGVIPRVVWSKVIAADEKGRIGLSLNCVLLEAVNAGRDGPQRVLIETGCSDRYDAKIRGIFGLADEGIEQALARAGVFCEQIDHVILSHLHFDHAGGLTRKARAGETPDWKDDSGDQAKLAFARASVIVQKQEWEDALANRSAMTKTYYWNHLEPIRPRVRLIESPRPFAVGYRPRRDELPATRVADRLTPVLPGISVFSIPGHTWGQQAVLFRDDRGKTVVFSADLMPTIHHVGAAYNMAYDVEPFTSTVSRGWFLREAMENGWTLVLDHEPTHPVRRVVADGKGWFTLEEAPIS